MMVIDKNEKLEILKWTNQDNIRFYDSVLKGWLPNLSIKLGLDSGCDLNLISAYIEKSQSILELGAGYGRVPEQLIARGYRGKITAIERCQWACQKMREQFGDKIEIIEADISQVQTATKYDLILWLWSGICDFSKEEQKKALLNVKDCLDTKGILVLDTLFPHIKPVTANVSYEQYHRIVSDRFAELHVYIPTIIEVAQYAKELEFSYFKHIKYITNKNSERILYVLSNKSVYEK